MTKFATFVLAIALALTAVAATPVAADEFSIAFQRAQNAATQPLRQLGQNLCEQNRDTGNATEASWCYGRETDGYGRVIGYNPNSVVGQARRGYGPYYSGYYYPGYWGDGITSHSSRFARLMHGIFAPAPYYPYGTRPYEDETPGKCFERVAKAAKKQHVPVSAVEIAAYCNGQVPTQGQSEEYPQAGPDALAPEPPPAPSVPAFTPAPAPQPAPTPRQSVQRRAAPDVYVQSGRICNDLDASVAVFVNGRRVGDLAPNTSVELSHLPGYTAGAKVTYYPLGR